VFWWNGSDLSDSSDGVDDRNSGAKAPPATEPFYRGRDKQYPPRYPVCTLETRNSLVFVQNGPTL
jgi:hypothetical protein